MREALQYKVDWDNETLTFILHVKTFNGKVYSFLGFTSNDFKTMYEFSQRIDSRENKGSPSLEEILSHNPKIIELSSKDIKLLEVK